MGNLFSSSNQSYQATNQVKEDIQALKIFLKEHGTHKIMVRMNITIPVMEKLCEDNDIQTIYDMINYDSDIFGNVSSTMAVGDECNVLPILLKHDKLDLAMKYYQTIYGIKPSIFLLWATVWNNLEVFQYIIEHHSHNVDISLKDVKQADDAPLTFWTVKYDRDEILTYIHQNNLLDIQTKFGESDIFSYAYEHQATKCIAYLRSLNIFQHNDMSIGYILQHDMINEFKDIPFDPENSKKNIETLFKAADHLAINIMKYLCEQGVSLNHIYKKRTILEHLLVNINTSEFDADRHVLWMMSRDLDLPQVKNLEHVIFWHLHHVSNHSKILHVAKILTNHGYQFDVDAVDRRSGKTYMQMILSSSNNRMMEYFSPMCKNKKFMVKDVDLRDLPYIESLGFVRE